MSETKTFVKNTIMTISRQVSSILIGLLSTIIIARLLGPSGNGMYSLVTLLPTMLLTMLNFGIGSSSVYFVGKKKYPLQTILKTNTLIGLLLSLVSIIIGIIVVLFFSEEFFKGVPHSYLYWILLLMPFLILNEYYLVLFQGTHDFKSFNTLALIRQMTALVFLVVFLFVFDTDLSGAIYSFIIGVLLQFAMSVYLLKKRLDLNILKGQFSTSYFKEAFSYGYKAHFSNILSFINYRADMFIISFFLTSTAVGIYGTAVNIAERLWIVSQAISSVLFPKVSSLESEEDRNKLTTTISRNVLFFSVLGGLVFFIVCKWVILLIFGAEYIYSATVLKVLLPGVILFSVERILSNDLAGRGKPEVNMYTSLFTVVSNLVLNILLVPKYGLVGAAFSTSSTYCLSTFIKMFIFKKITGVSITKMLIIQQEDILLYKQVFGKLIKRRMKA